MFLKQYSYKPRSNSQSSTGSEGTAQKAAAAQAAAGTSPPKDTGASVADKSDSGPVSAGIAGRRRSSAADSGKFAGLTGYKRNSQDGSATDRKASWADQKPGQGGMLSQAWNNFTKGT